MKSCFGEKSPLTILFSYKQIIGLIAINIDTGVLR